MGDDKNKKSSRFTHVNSNVQHELQYLALSYCTWDPDAYAYTTTATDNDEAKHLSDDQRNVKMTVYLVGSSRIFDVDTRTHSVDITTANVGYWIAQTSLTALMPHP